MKFNELTDEQWEFIKPILPPNVRAGRQRANDRMTINGILNLSQNSKNIQI